MARSSEVESCSFILPFHATGLFLYPPKNQKIFVFRMFSRGIERDQWYEMCQSIKLSHSKLPNCAFQLQLIIIINRSSHRRCSVKKTVLNNFAIFTGKHLCLIKLRAFCNFIEKETLAQVFSSKICEIFENINFEEHVQTAASASIYLKTC